MIRLTCKKCNNEGLVNFEYINGSKFSSSTSFRCDLCGAEDNDINLEFCEEKEEKEEIIREKNIFEYEEEDEFETDMCISNWVPR